MAKFFIKDNVSVSATVVMQNKETHCFHNLLTYSEEREDGDILYEVETAETTFAFKRSAIESLDFRMLRDSNYQFNSRDSDRAEHERSE